MIEHEPRQQCAPPIRTRPAGFPCHQHRAGDVVKAARRSTCIRLQRRFGGDAVGKIERSLQCRAQAVAECGRNRGRLVQPLAERCGQRAVRATLADGARHDIERVDVAGAFPEHADMSVADQPRIHPFLDVAVAAAHFHRAGGDRNVVAAGAEFQQRREDAQDVCGLRVAAIGAIHRVRREQEHRQRLLGRQHDLEKLAAQQRIFDDGLAERRRGCSRRPSLRSGSAASSRMPARRARAATG